MMCSIILIACSFKLFILDVRFQIIFFLFYFINFNLLFLNLPPLVPVDNFKAGGPWVEGSLFMVSQSYILIMKDR